MIRIAVLALSLIGTGLAGAASAQESAIAVEHVWARATPGKAETGAVYAEIVNHGNAPDRLLAVSSPVAEKADLHQNKLENGIMKMRPVDTLTIAPGKSEELAPGGYHIMLMGLAHPLHEGESFPVTLTFEKAGKVTATVSVKKAGAMSGQSMEHMHSSGPGK